MSYCLSMKKEPGIDCLNIVNFQKKHHAFRGTQNHKSVSFPRGFFLPFGNYFSLLAINFNIEFGRNCLTKSHAGDLLIEISTQTILNLVLVEEVFQNGRIGFI